VVLVAAGLPAGAWVLLARPGVHALLRIASTLLVGGLVLVGILKLGDLPGLASGAVLFVGMVAGYLSLRAFVRRRPSRRELAEAWQSLWYSKRPNERGEEENSHDVRPPPNDGGVEALLGLALATVDDERERGRALDTKAASLVASTGVILSLNATLGRTLLDTDLGPTGNCVLRISFLVAVIALLVGVLVALGGVLRPQKYRGLHRQAIRDFAAPKTQAMTKLQVHQAMLGSAAAILDQDRGVNDFKATLTKVTASALAVGFFGVAGEAITLVLRKLGV
jgi:hypothetical protein